MTYILRTPDSPGKLELSRDEGQPIMGPGAPHDRTWGEVESAMSVNQGSGLPDQNTFYLQDINPILKLHDRYFGPYNGYEYYHMWYETVYNELRPHHLHLLIDVNVPRPPVNDPNAERWYNLSKRLVGYLMQSVAEPQLAVEILNKCYGCTFAEEFVTAMKICMRERGDHC